eukprot:CAMPEP_0179366192 /NCGR_PEP_ID=MMETSP0797-20121207/82938_1 /TAXON_ID=47934 /ORGANISM="Dinophysis acuminata, Strain DAEP01" /LENGTH=276 /DNA_ID=CAMNT_0021081715 /DNA_START=30 /DNA_END=857 /DNA_ORIENTATION=+
MDPAGVAHRVELSPLVHRNRSEGRLLHHEPRPGQLVPAELPPVDDQVVHHARAAVPHGNAHDGAVGGLLGGEHHEPLRHVIRAEHPAERLLDVLDRGPLRGRGVRRAQTVNAHIGVVAEGEAHGAGEVHHRRLHCGVYGRRAERQDPRHRGGADDHAAPLLAKRAHRDAGPLYVRVEVDLRHVAQLGGVPALPQVRYHVTRLPEPGIVEPAGQCPEFRGRAGRALQVLPAPGVAVHEPHPAGVLGRQLLALLVLDVGDDDLAAQRHPLQRGGPADA